MPSYIYNATTKELEYVAGGTLYAEMPIGTIVPFGGSTVPDGYEMCDGSEVLKTDYPDLYAVIGDSFGTASDNTKFVLPDLRGEFIRGAGTNSHSGEGDGGNIGTHQAGSVVNGVYINSDNTAWAASVNGMGNATPDKVVSSSMRGFASTDRNASVNPSTYKVRPTNTSVNFIIKAAITLLPLDFQQAVDEVQQNVDGLSDSVGILSDSVSNLSDDLNTLSENVGTLSDNVDTLSDNVGTLSDNVDTLSDNVESITPTVLVQTLTAGSTSLTFTDSSITNNSRIIITTDPYTQGAVANAVQSGTTVTITFNAQSSNIRVALEIRN